MKLISLKKVAQGNNVYFISFNLEGDRINLQKNHKISHLLTNWNEREAYYNSSLKTFSFIFAENPTS